jgi:uncharacterized protein (UPF0303 family)
MAHPVPQYSLAEVEAAGRVELPHFTNADAFVLGTTAGEIIREWGLSLAVDIVIDGYVAYRARLGTTGRRNDKWIERKAATATHFGDSTLLVKLRHQETGAPFADLDLDHDVMLALGGSIPIYVAGQLVATITASGETDVVDHEVLAEAVNRYLVKASTATSGGDDSADK